MNILILGGTGAMGTPLVSALKQYHTIYVTSRTAYKSTDNVKYIQGNAREKDFLEKVLTMFLWDAVVDFMVRGAEFESLTELFLSNTKQYIFISSARVYAQSDTPITEKNPRLLDICQDKEYLATNEYALSKAREENILYKSGKNNFTIIRPTITYNDYRLQLGVLEKENWLYRVLHGRTIVFSDDIRTKLTTMTHGDDVATGIASVIGEEKAYGETFHITYNNSLLWDDVLNVYKMVLEKHLNKEVKIKYTEKSTNLQFKHKIYQVIYCRYFNRTFDNSKIAKFCDIERFKPPQKGLAKCLENFLQNPKFGNIDWNLEAVNDRVSGEKTPLKEISGIKNKVYYLCYRYNLTLVRKAMSLLSRIIKKIK